MNPEEHEAYHKKLIYIFVIILVILFGGALAFHYFEKWDPLDSLYFSAATMTTVGYGDITPKTSMGKIFNILYMFTSVGIALYGLSVLGAHFVEEREEHWMHEILNHRKHTKNFREGFKKIFLNDKSKMIKGHEELFSNNKK